MPYLLLLLFIPCAVWQSAQLMAMRQEAQDIARDIAALQDQQGALQDEMNQIQGSHDRLSRNILEMQSEISKWVIDPDIPLSAELQRHTVIACEFYRLDLDDAYGVMYHESRMIPDVPDNLNPNGSIDTGLMQINSINWTEMQSLGLDVRDPKDNITAGCYILSRNISKYGRYDGLRAYADGPTGMLNGGGHWFVEELAAQKIKQ